VRKGDWLSWGDDHGKEVRKKKISYCKGKICTPTECTAEIVETPDGKKSSSSREAAAHAY